MQTHVRLHKTPGAIRSLLAGAIDYAGLFPPAALSLRAALRNYATYRASRNSWMLGRFILSASLLPELHEELRLMASDTPWIISALVGQDYQSEIQTIELFNRQNTHRAFVDVIEVKPELHRNVEEFLAATPIGTTVYFEIPLTASLELLKSIRRSGARAKVRTGGLVPEAIPDVVSLAVCIQNCSAAAVAFKATAGLHHPIRSVRPLTYAPDAPSGEMHGFVNLLIASAFAMDGTTCKALCDVLAERQASCFRFTDAGARWKDKSVSMSKLREAREQLAISFGSCSFEEPLEDLSVLGWL